MAKLRTISPPVLDPNINMAENILYEGKTIPLDGKLDLATHPAHVKFNFTELLNMRYTDTHPESVYGMKNLSGSGIHATYKYARNCYHLLRTLHKETHVLVQAFNETNTSSAILDNTTEIPQAGSFNSSPLWIDSKPHSNKESVKTVSTSPNIGWFSSAPHTGVCYCNGVDVCIWEGKETRVAAFITGSNDLYDAAQEIKDVYDATHLINDTLDTPRHLVRVGV